MKNTSMLATCNDLAISGFLTKKNMVLLCILLSFCWRVMHSASTNTLQHQDDAIPLSLNHFHYYCCKEIISLNKKRVAK